MQESTNSVMNGKEMRQKNIISEYFKLVAEGRFKEGLRFFAPDCKTHNPFVAGNMENIVDAMIAANKDYGPKYPEAEFALKQVISDGDFVAAYTQTTYGFANQACRRGTEANALIPL